MSEEKINTRWGWWKEIWRSPKIRIKVLFIEAGKSISLQKHRQRDEHWLVLSGYGVLYIDGKIHHLVPDSQATIEKNQTHKVIAMNPYIQAYGNFKDEPLVIFETQTGAYTEEDDIIRYEDITEEVVL
jgi:mannose-6-phosphate isomerase-like protein (cupin superfamily)